MSVQGRRAPKPFDFSDFSDDAGVRVATGGSKIKGADTDDDDEEDDKENNKHNNPMLSPRLTSPGERPPSTRHAKTGQCFLFTDDDSSIQSPGKQQRMPSTRSTRSYKKGKRFFFSEEVTTPTALKSPGDTRPASTRSWKGERTSTRQRFLFSEEETTIRSEKRVLKTEIKFDAVTPSTPLSTRSSISASSQLPSLTPLCLENEENDISSQILPYLMISNRGDALLNDTRMLRKSGIVYIVNCCEKSAKRGAQRQINHISSKKDFSVLNLNLKDEPTFDLTNAFELVFPFILRAKEENKVCLIYCHSGMSRSVTLALAYLIVCERMTLIEAMSHVKRRRQMASPNPGFMAQLIALERSIDKYKGGDGTSVTVDLKRYKSDRFGQPEAFTRNVEQEFQYYYYRGYTKRIYGNDSGETTGLSRDDSINSNEDARDNAKSDGAQEKGHRRDVSATTFLLPLVEKSMTQTARASVASGSKHNIDDNITMLKEHGKTISPNGQENHQGDNCQTAPTAQTESPPPIKELHALVETHEELVTKTASFHTTAINTQKMELVPSEVSSTKEWLCNATDSTFLSLQAVMELFNMYGYFQFEHHHKHNGYNDHSGNGS